MAVNKKLIILIPAYEPDENLIKLVEKLNKNKIDSVIVDDGSGSNYKNIFSKCKSKVISYDKNHGKGYALKTGLKYIKENYKDYIVVTMDSDGQHTIKDAINLYEYVNKNDEELVLGKRIRSSKTPIKSRIGNMITRRVFRKVTGYDIYDTQTGLRAFSNKLMDYMLSIDGDRFEYEMNVLLNLKTKNIKVKEIDIEVIYIDNNSNSHFNGITDSIRIYKQILKYKKQ